MISRGRSISLYGENCCWFGFSSKPAISGGRENDSGFYSPIRVKGYCQIYGRRERLAWQPCRQHHSQRNRCAQVRVPPTFQVPYFGERAPGTCDNIFKNEILKFSDRLKNIKPCYSEG